MEAGLHLFLEAEIKRTDISDEELAARLKDQGINKSAASLANKLAKGTFPITFFLACPDALELEGIRLEDMQDGRVTKGMTIPRQLILVIAISATILGSALGKSPKPSTGGQSPSNQTIQLAAPRPKSKSGS